MGQDRIRLKYSKIHIQYLSKRILLEDITMARNDIVQTIIN